MDQLSDGRITLGVGLAWSEDECDVNNVPFRQRGRLFERNLDLLCRLWTGDRVTARVDEFNLREAVMRPRPLQTPRPPILIGGYVDAVLHRAATRGDGWLTYFYTPEGFRRGWERVLGHARAAGRDPASLTATNQLAIYVGRARGRRRRCAGGSRPSGMSRRGASRRSTMP